MNICAVLLITIVAVFIDSGSAGHSKYPRNQGDDFVWFNTIGANNRQKRCRHKFTKPCEHTSEIPVAVLADAYDKVSSQGSLCTSAPTKPASAVFEISEKNIFEIQDAFTNAAGIGDGKVVTSEVEVSKCSTEEVEIELGDTTLCLSHSSEKFVPRCVSLYSNEGHKYEKNFWEDGDNDQFYDRTVDPELFEGYDIKMPAIEDFSDINDAPTFFIIGDAVNAQQRSRKTEQMPKFYNKAKLSGVVDLKGGRERILCSKIEEELRKKAGKHLLSIDAELNTNFVDQGANLPYNFCRERGHLKIADELKGNYEVRFREEENGEVKMWRDVFLDTYNYQGSSGDYEEIPNMHVTQAYHKFYDFTIELDNDVLQCKGFDFYQAAVDIFEGKHAHASRDD